VLPFAITAGCGLLLGLGLLIWGLRMRGKLADSEMLLEKSRGTVKELLGRLDEAGKALDALHRDRQSLERQVISLRGTIEELRQQLIQCRDPATVRRWLDEEMGKKL